MNSPSPKRSPRQKELPEFHLFPEDQQRLFPYLGGFPGPRVNNYRPHHYDAAVTTDACPGHNVFLDCFFTVNSSFELYWKHVYSTMDGSNVFHAAVEQVGKECALYICL